jgi:hypothetical protein
MQFITDCVGVPYQDLDHLHQTIDSSTDITYRTFRKQVGGDLVDWIAQSLGYDPTGRNLHIKQDWAVRFYRSTGKGKRCYFLVWSGIEYIFQ